MPVLHEKGDELILADPDPAVPTLKGHRRYLVGLDVAQSVDQNAFTIIMDEQMPAPEGLQKRRREIVRAERIPQMSYVDLAVVTRNLMTDTAIADKAYLVVDAGGPGRAFADLLLDKGVMATRMQIVGGESENEKKERNVSFANVGKPRLLMAINSALHTGELKIGNFPMREKLREEIESVERHVTAAGRQTFSMGTEDGHADILMSAAMAFWLSDHRSVGASFGEFQLSGYW